jgi:uncharacterized membrane protein
MRSRLLTSIFIVAAAAGLFFSSMSTMDFVQFLDRQTHDIHCSFAPGLPGVEDQGATGSSDCHVTLMSPYSSVLRSSLWGGIPISLGGMGVFAFLLFRGVDLLVNRRELERGATGFLALAAVLPLLTSLGMGYISLVQLDAACKLCIGIYASSLVVFLMALLIWRIASDPRLGENIGLRGEPAPVESQGVVGHIASFLTGVGFVAVPVLVYMTVMPNYDKYVGTCGTLPKPADTAGIMVPVGQQATGKDAIEVFDPLCPSCRAFEHRLEASGLDKQLKRKAVMFPLDSCNWMIPKPERPHPGACEVSAAVLCAGDKADAVIDWAFMHQEEIKAVAGPEGKGAAAMVGEHFPEYKACIGDAKTKRRLRESMAWAVENQIEILTPQIFVDGAKLCDADTDLGLDYMLPRLMAQGPAPATSEAR